MYDCNLLYLQILNPSGFEGSPFTAVLLVYLYNSDIWSMFYIEHLGPDADADSDEEWPALGQAGAADGDVGCETEVFVDPDDEKAIEMFMSKNPPMR